MPDVRPTCVFCIGGKKTKEKKNDKKQRDKRLSCRIDLLFSMKLERTLGYLYRRKEKIEVDRLVFLFFLAEFASFKKKFSSASVLHSTAHRPFWREEKREIGVEFDVRLRTGASQERPQVVRGSAGKRG